MKPIKVVLFGSTGMVGQGVLRECLMAPQVEQVLCVTRRATDTPAHGKLVELVHPDFSDFESISSKLKSYDACFWCLGVSSGGMPEAQYTKITYDYTVAAAKAMAHPDMTFVYVSGDGTDSSEKGAMGWARIKVTTQGKTENALLGMNFKAAYMFRPGIIQPKHGIESATPSYRIAYKIIGPCFPLIKALLPSSVTCTENMGRAMLQCALSGAPKSILYNKDINSLAQGYISMAGLAGQKQ